ncbi:hypothetical protein [Grimontia marina]|uniref:hypothetical protein n=1 Tax=Grimontia marina TaxID=646534 RepID=UPI0007882513|nr:hypothetical protein [Grimontia marina]
MTATFCPNFIDNQSEDSQRYCHSESQFFRQNCTTDGGVGDDIFPRAIDIPKQREEAGFSEIDWHCDRDVPLKV